MNACLANALRPPPSLRPDEFAERYISLDGMSRYEGLVKLNRTPYLRGLLIVFWLGVYLRMIFVFATQVGKTLLLQIIMAYLSKCDPGTMMVIYPQRDTAKRRSKNHLQRFFREMPVLSDLLPARADALQLFEFSLTTMRVLISWAGSPAMLAAEPIRYLIRDEFAKYKHIDKSEAHPMHLSRRRVSSYGDLARIIDATTPTLTTLYGHKDLVEGTWHEFWVPCPHCGKPEDVADIDDPVVSRDDGEVARIRERLTAAGYQVLYFKGIDWCGEKDPDKVAEVAQYVCSCCKARIDNSAKLAMTQKGKWVPKQPGKSEFSAWLPSWYRDEPDTSFGQVARRFVLALGDPRAMQDWKNNDDAMGFEETGVEVKPDAILARRKSYQEDELPFEPLYIIVSVDIRAPEMHYVVRAVTYYETSAQLRYGVLPRIGRDPGAQGEATGDSLRRLDQIRALTFRFRGRDYPVNLTLIDANYDTDEVYAYCRKRPGCVAVRGRDRMTDSIRHHQPEKDPVTGMARPDSVHEIEFNSGYHKDILFAKLAVPSDASGEWMLHATVGEDFAKHMTGERKVAKRKRNGSVVFEYKQTHENHLLDCENIQIVAWRFINIRDMRPGQAQDDEELDTGHMAGGRDFSGLAARARR